MQGGFYFRPVIPLLGSYICGILAGAGVPGKLLWALPALPLCAGMLFWKIRKNRAGRLCPIFLFFILGYLSIQPWAAPKIPSRHIAAYLNRPPIPLAGTILGIDPYTANRIRLTLETDTVFPAGSPEPSAGRIQVTVLGNGPGLSTGDRIRFSAKIRSFRNYNNPGGFDYRRFMAFKKIWGTAYVPAAGISVLKRGTPGGLSGWTGASRAHISRRIEENAHENAAGILKAILVGDRTGVSPRIRSAFHRTGTGHILAISGLHIGIIATVWFFVFQGLLARIPPILWRAWSRKGAALLCFIPVWIYGLLSGMSPSTQRALIMVSIFLAALLLEREGEPMNTLAMAALLILIIDPPCLFSISFQLSFAAVCAMLWGFGWIRVAPGARRRDRIRSLALSFVLATAFATLGTLPLVMRYFNEVSWVGLLGNLLVVPVIGFGVVPLGLLSVFLVPISPTAADACITLGSAVVLKVLHLLTSLSSLPFAAVKTITPSWLEISGYYLLGLAVVSALDTRGGVRRTGIIGGMVVIIVLTADAGYWLHRRFWHDDLRVTAIDVGQGNATLLELPGGRTLLIDGGGFADNAAFDVGARIVAPFLWHNKIRSLDLLILTHPDSDHLNGLLYITEHFHVESLWSNGQPAPSKGYAELRRIVAERKIEMPEYRGLPPVQDFGAVRMELIHPPRDFLNRAKTEAWRTFNNNSLVMQVRFGSISFLFPGDIEAMAEKELVARRPRGLRSTVLFAPHHGSPLSSTPEFLDATAPEIVVISAGWRSLSPASPPAAWGRYTDRKCRVFSTAAHGAVLLRTDGRTLAVRTLLEPGG